ncbi:MAG: Gfo/Idh/MocA family oxidoreductase [Candidatus Tectomicrobia bacterium]|jgi:predicted dehydrogenase|nr:Gfo/Idh/MocA family oxidoreductase [Candidatus Tectomicrobia bacterium]HEX2277933.1 Gfo/Idh/MocA family oxidoreductase [Candidatus Tectomicrobia bacterium]
MALGWAIISTGLHVDSKIAPAINATPDAELVATCSREQERADACARKHGAKAAYSDLGALLRDSRVDAVFIASPNALHAQHALQAARAGKHVFCEKPMTTTLDDAVAMVRTCRDRGVKLGVGYHLRQHPGVREARRLIAEGVLGSVALAQGQWGFGVRGQDRPPPRTGLRQWWDDPELIGHASTMMGTGVHVIDTLRFVLDQEVTEVAAVSDGQTPQQPLEQLVAMSLRFDRGAIATVCCGRRLPDSRNDLVIYGSLGRLVGSDALWEGRQGTFEVVSETVNTTETYPHQPLANFIDELDDFRRAIRDDREPAASGFDGLRVVQVTLAMIASAREQRTVRIEPLTA